MVRRSIPILHSVRTDQSIRQNPLTLPVTAELGGPHPVSRNILDK